MGSLTTSKISPKDAGVLVTVAADSSLDGLAKAGRALKGYAQTRNSGADIFLANPTKGSTSDAFATGGCVALECDLPARLSNVAEGSSSAMTFRLSISLRLWWLHRQSRSGRSPSDVSLFQLTSSRFCCGRFWAAGRCAQGRTSSWRQSAFPP